MVVSKNAANGSFITKVKDFFQGSNPVMGILQGMLIGAGAELPGVSGGVLCVVFGVYKPIMRLLAHPIKELKNSAKLLIPVIVGFVLGFLLIAKLLGFVLETYEAQSLCLFIGLTAGMLPSMFREAGEQGRSKASWIGMAVAFVIVFALLMTLKIINVTIAPNFGWFLFCGFCMAMSIIAPGLSFSTLLMPLGLYGALSTGIGNLDFGVLIPAGIGAVITVIALSKFVGWLLDKHYSVMFHSIIGIVIAATVMIIPVESLTAGALPCLNCIAYHMNPAHAAAPCEIAQANIVVCLICMAVGLVAALALDKFNSSVEKPE